MANTIQHYRGPKAALPTLAQGQLGYCTDTDEVYVGDGVANHAVNVRRFAVRLVASDTSVAADTSIGGDYRLSSAAITVITVGAYVDTAGSDAVTTIDINEAGSTILSTKITIDSGEKTSQTAATPAVISDSAIAADGIVTFDVDSVPGTAPQGLVVWMQFVE